MIIRMDTDELTYKDIKAIIDTYDFSQIESNLEYYLGNNPSIWSKWQEKRYKGTKPNYVMPTPYYSTLVDSAVAYSFNDISYMDKQGDGKKSDELIKKLKSVLNLNYSDVLDQKIGGYQLGAGVAYEIHYVDSEGNNRFDIIPPNQGIPIYSQDLETRLIEFIYVRDVGSIKVITYYTKTKTLEWEVKDKKERLTKDLPNDYKDIPIVVYWNTYEKGDICAVPQKVKHYIDAIDAVATGTLNDIEKHAEAILLMMSQLKAEDVEDLKDKRLLQGLDPEEIKNIKYLTKEVQYEYIQFFYKMLVTEIHKHTHIIDFQDPNAGVGSAASGEALAYRMIDMDSQALRYERLNREGQYRRLKLIADYNGWGDTSGIEVNYSHNIPKNKMLEMEKLNNITFISERTKQEMSGIDPDVEKERMDEEKSLMPDLFQDPDNQDDNADDIQDVTDNND